jgi:prepilin-type N-terminal cleavage/methylation domain-containing protein
MDKKGFTLIELLIVITIIGVLAAIAVPAYIGQQKRAERSEASSNLEALRLLEEQFFAENGRYAPNPDATLSYKGTHGIADSGLEDVLTGFKPGDASDLSFTYTIVSSGTGTAFIATATGKTGKRVAGDVFTINQNNERNF